MDVIRIAVLGIAGLFLCIFLKDTKPEYALYVSLATGVCILLLATGKLSYLMEMLNRLKSYVPIDTAYLNALLAELERKGAAHREKISGFFGEKTQVAIDATVRARLMERLCAAFDGERPADEIEEDVMLLALFLKKTGVLKGRVDAETYRKIAVKLREGRKLPKNKAAFELIDYVEEIWLLLMTAAT